MKSLTEERRDDLRPGYTDTLSAGKWRAIYCVDGEQVGQWDPVVKVHVGG